MRLLPGLFLGIAAGMRSMSAPAIAAAASRGNNLQLGRKSRLQRNLSTLLQALALAELVADKLPFIPDRRKPPAFAWRIASGALTAAAIAEEGDSRVLAAAIGAAGAAAGTLGGAALRGELAKAFGHDLPAALTEDALVLALILAARTGLKAPQGVLEAAA